MCGIAGILNLHHPRRIQLNQLEKLALVLQHRGPDKSGMYVDDSIGLVHSRLSIIGLEDGIQPIHNEDKSLWITYNGEIYNYLELRKDLIKSGHKFYTNTDTEVLIHLYEDKGIDFVNYLNGQFAFAIWDTKKKELLLVRDRLGIRPLHYTITNNQFIFSSEIKSIFSQDSVKRSINIESLKQIFTYWSTLSGNTIFEDIKAILPGHYLKISSGKVEQKKYWELPFSRKEEKLNWSIDRIVEKVDDLLNDSIRLRLRADVTVGSYLSGGLDSSVIASVVKNKFNKNLNTFGIRFNDEAYDEGSYQNEIVQQLKTKHTEIVASDDDIAQNFTKSLWHIEAPILRTAPVPLYLLSQKVHEMGIKVVLTGEGADEFFGGYNIFKEAKARYFWSKIPNSDLRPKLLANLYPYITKDSKLNVFQKLFFGQGLDKPNSPFFSHQVRWNNTKRINNFLADQHRNDLNGKQLIQSDKLLPKDSKERDYFEKAQSLEVNTFLSNYLLSSQGDRVAMANSVELRFPFLDHRLIEFLAKVPSKYKIYGMNEKFLLKKAFRNSLPRNIIARLKHPYRAPISNSLLNKSNNTNIEKYLSNEAIKSFGIFNEAKTTKLIGKLSRTENKNEVENMALSGIYSTQVIYDLFINDFQVKANNNFKFDLVIDKRKVK